ncbi:hypothetical protein F8M41_023613 [Gigaspora margarita]|uniref:Uncharacterized protein n=1 Tax=Gigaspora margarita TaxID=4874 RepID=A0A8H4EGS8_GIGMA|nr:hypothetical protein F8M41_023613 [Gigaspora margarita]
MTRESLLQKAECQLSSNDIVKAALTYLKATEGLLSCQRQRNEISKEDYQFRTEEIKYFRNTIESLITEVKNLKDEINKLKNENQGLQDEINKFRNENQGLHEAMNNLSQNFSSIHLNENKDTIDAGLSKIVEIIEIKADPSMIIDKKSTFDILIIPEILAEITNNLSPGDINIFRFITRFIFLEKDIEMFVKELKQIKDDNLAYRWLQEKENIVNQFQKNVLKKRHTLINDSNMEMMLNRNRFYIPSEYHLCDNLNSIHSNYI